LIHCHRFSDYFAKRIYRLHDEKQTDAEREALITVYGAALQIISAHINIAHQGLMTYCEH